MHHPEQWPPSKKINPLFVSLHINVSAKDALLSEESINYLKRFQPIGCRDYFTRDLLMSKGIEAYFSACLTLTLGMSYQSTERENKCYFVDPFLPKKTIMFDEICQTLWFLTHPNVWHSIWKIAKKFPYKSVAKKGLYGCRFYRTYIKIFTKETLIEAEYISHRNKGYQENFKTDKERLDEAMRLVNKYVNAKMVITSRIHCALPCLGLETPVILTENHEQSERTSCRMGGIRDFFHIISFRKNGFETNFPFHNDRKLSIATVPMNKDSWKEHAFKLAETCRSFIARDNE